MNKESVAVIRKFLGIGFATLLAGMTFGAPVTASAAPGLSGFTCGTQSGGSDGVFAPITAVRVGHHIGYDRFVVEFSGSVVPGYRAIPKSSATFYSDPLGQPVTLEGSAGIKLVMHSTSMSGTYGGPADFDPEFPQLAEARSIGDFEGFVTWGLSLERQSCKRIFLLSSPARLVVDVPA
jgi:hypothetical protein